MHRYRCYNAAMATTAKQASVTTGTSIKTMLQVAPPSTRQIQLLSWGFTIDAQENGHVELLQTDVAATVTAHIAAGVQPLVPGMPASLVTLGTAATGYTSTAEGSTTSTRMFDAFQTDLAGSSAQTSYEKVWLPGRGPIVAVSTFLRVRAHMGTAVNMVCWVEWDE